MTHLSSKQVSDWILGEREPEVSRHVESCGKCLNEIEKLQGGLLAFRSAVHEWAEEPAAVRIPARRPSWRWAVAAAAAMGLALLPMYLDVRNARREAEYAAERAKDALLLNQVNAHLARTVPQPMQQLMELMIEGKEGLQ